MVSSRTDDRNTGACSGFLRYYPEELTWSENKLYWQLPGVNGGPSVPTLPKALNALQRPVYYQLQHKPQSHALSYPEDPMNSKVQD